MIVVWVSGTTHFVAYDTETVIKLTGTRLAHHLPVTVLNPAQRMPIYALESLLHRNGNRMGVWVHQVQIEVILLSISDVAALRWRVAKGDLPSGCRPDARARELAGLALSAPAGTVVHSTSWRPAASGLILTYAVLPDPTPGEHAVRTVPADATIACSTDAASPTPSAVAVEHVLAHALRHLSMVARTTPAVISAVDAYPRLWDAVLAHTPGVAGQLVGTGAAKGEKRDNSMV